MERRLEELKQLDGEPHRKAACALRAHPTFGRYIRQTKTGKLRLDKARIKGDSQLDGKFLLSTSDDSLPAEDVVMGYMQLMDVERCFRDLKHTLDVRPVYHRLSTRIQSQVLLCWLGLLLIRIAEQHTGETWHSIQRTIQPLPMGIRSRAGEVWQSTPVRSEQGRLFDNLSLKHHQSITK